jgi:aromatic ring-opening dioxygenase catalytic subunit (LigB family)
MTLAFAGCAAHAPGLTGRLDLCPDEEKGPYLAAQERLRERIEDAKLDALMVITAEHFGNFFSDNMPAFCIGIGDDYEGPVEDEDFLKIPKTTVPGTAELSNAIAMSVMEEFDLSFSQELLLDHGVMVPLHYLTPKMDIPIVPLIVNCLIHPRPPMARCYDLGKALRKAIDARPERIGMLGAGGISHWPACPEAGRINQRWDAHFLDDFLNHRRRALTVDYDDETIDEEGGPGGHEIRAWTIVSGATERCQGKLHIYQPMPAYAIGGAIATMAV